MRSIALLTSWNLLKTGDGYFVSGTHHVYLKYICSRYEKVHLISSVNNTTVGTVQGKRIDFPNLKITELPATYSYLGAQKNILRYYSAIKEVAKNTDLFYTRVPDPFCWMPKLLFGKKTIMHFVGDTIDTTMHNEAWSLLKKKIMIAGYKPDYCLTLKAARKSRVYTNGYHLAERLAKRRVEATPVISSTVEAESLTRPLSHLRNHKGPVRIVYLGYIRFAKGIKCLMELLAALKNGDTGFHFDIIGDGEMMDELKRFIVSEELSDKVTLQGHIDDRDKVNELLKLGDLFFFPSLSEGSPRVIIEAMSQGIPVISTPVGSLPSSFEEGREIRFFGFNRADEAFEIIKEYIRDREPFIKIRENAFAKVKNNYTIEAFLSKVFYYEA